MASAQTKLLIDSSHDNTLLLMPMNLTPGEELGNPELIMLEENLIFAQLKSDESKKTKLLHMALLERLLVFRGGSMGALWGVHRITATIMVMV